MGFFSRTVAERTAQGQRQSVQENNYTAHVYNRGGAEQLAGEFQLFMDIRTPPEHDSTLTSKPGLSFL
jgi:hypothetical protein